MDIDLIKKSYEEELNTLKIDRIHLHDMISTIHEESKDKIAAYVETKEKLKTSKIFLEGTLN